MKRMLPILLCAMLLAGCHPTSGIDVLNRAVDDMRVCQRTADNRAFYEHWVRARRAIDRIEEEEQSLSPDERSRFLQARDEFYLISVTYHYTMGHHDQMEADMAAIDETELAARDEGQWQHYRYLRGLAAHVGHDSLAQQAWKLSHYGDSAYWVTEARIHCATAMNRASAGTPEQYLAALDTLQLAYNCIAEDNVPECLCRISEQMSVAYAGLGRKDSSDIYRNIYLDMLEVIRENKELEYRTAEAERRTAEVKRLSGAFLVFLAVFLIGFAVLAVLARKRHLQFTRRMGERHDERMEQFHEELEMHKGGLTENKRAYIRRKASIAIVTSIIPYIDRMRHALEVNKSVSADDLHYVSELAGRIEELNDILAGWIQTRQGIVGLHIETFAVSGLFDILARRRGTFEGQGLQLDIADTDAWVKADRALTLFMLNTLTDNARKFTPEGGRISLSADVHDDYVELSVADTGIGLSEEDIREILGHKVFDVSHIGGEGAQHGSGFGLMNCKGIIEKYRKTDSFFSVCQLGIDSTRGKGSRFWFRLPRAVKRTLALLVVAFGIAGNSFGEEKRAGLEAAAAWADSIYYANLDGRYEEAVSFGDSALYYLNADMRERCPEELDSLTLTTTGARGGTTEAQWWMSDFETDYYTILDVRNELAVAFLALHQLDDYRFNNRSYGELYKLTSEDTQLADYIEQMQQTRRDIVTMLVVGLVLLLAFIIFWWTFIVRPRKARRRELEKRDKELARMVDEDNEMRRVRYEENRLHVQNMVLDNCLSTIKHETAYYPGRIRQMADRLSDAPPPYDDKQLADIAELTDFYRDIFGTLAACAARQLEESPFRRQDIPCEELLGRAAAYLRSKVVSAGLSGLKLDITHDGGSVSGDEVMLTYLLESLIDEALQTGQRTKSEARQVEAALSLTAERRDGFVAFRFTNPGVTLGADELQELFYPSTDNTGYIICRQIVREHDEYFGHIGCRIKAEQAATDGGLTILFTLPAATTAKNQPQERE